MKKRIALLLLVCAMLLSACQMQEISSNISEEESLPEESSFYEESSSEEEPSSEEESADASDEASQVIIDTRKPRIIDSTNTKEIAVKVGSDTDFMMGISGTDNIDGDITDKIVIDKGDYDKNKAGEYTVTYKLTDSSGNTAEYKRTYTVKESKILVSPPTYEGTIPDEAPKPQPPAVFSGAWYYKVVSSRDKWCGMEATVTLPSFDINRYNGSYDNSLSADPNVKNLDNPSVYFGGNALYESDVGLSLSKTVLDGKSKISIGSVAFRPFWRYITTVDKDVGGYDVHNGEYAVSANGNNCMANYHWKYTEYYYLPGDTLRVIINIPDDNKMQLQIEVIEKSTLPEAVAIREKYGWRDPADFVSPVFSSPGHGKDSIVEFKRVNAIDQSGNEGKNAIPTDTTVTNAVWHSVYLYRMIDGKLYKVPMDETRSASRKAPNDTPVQVSFDGGKEIVSIMPDISGK